MLKGIAAAENDQLQRQAEAVEGQLFRRRITNPAKILAGVCCTLQQLGWICIKAKWRGSLLVVDARVGAKRKRRLSATKLLTAEDVLFSDLVRAARKVGLKPGIEDIGVKVAGQQVLGTVGAVPVAIMDAALDRMLVLWREQYRKRRPVADQRRPHEVLFSGRPRSYAALAIGQPSR